MYYFTDFLTKQIYCIIKHIYRHRNQKVQIQEWPVAVYIGLPNKVKEYRFTEHGSKGKKV